MRQSASTSALPLIRSIMQQVLALCLVTKDFSFSRPLICTHIANTAATIGQIQLLGVSIENLIRSPPMRIRRVMIA
ncbi:uncharacterized protein PHALS_14852 [Plasmopara halstedii]|uniref:RxLR-like protein n=1 Tax=Plasmopara halstedii TaxID=4781 RepID=A0A0P1AWI8_PLAHL|nr:uncharacterized protein PHALS_14852 [Plasmopara halstedii]CEG45966.1 hypothetical protein PHALS_14852 [Plasmopara halstedii]|eukprot:XP_024582335.1 hypothetical protein PHALS_14852 [Plasmopara halstedii]